MDDVTHVHRYYHNENKPVFEPMVFEGMNEVVYRQVWYSFSACSCGAAMRTEAVKK